MENNINSHWSWKWQSTLEKKINLTQDLLKEILVATNDDPIYWREIEPHLNAVLECLIDAKSKKPKNSNENTSNQKSEITFPEVAAETKEFIDKFIKNWMQKSNEIFWWNFIDEVLVMDWNLNPVYYYSMNWTPVFKEDIEEVLKAHEDEHWLVFLEWQEWENFDILISEAMIDDEFNDLWTYFLLLNNSETTFEWLTQNKEKWLMVQSRLMIFVNKLANNIHNLIIPEIK